MSKPTTASSRGVRDEEMITGISKFRFPHKGAMIDMNEFHRIDWVKAEKFYRAGVISLAAIGGKCGCTKQAVSKKAKEKGWTRDLAPKVRQLAKRKLLEETQRKLLEETAETKGRKPKKQRRAPPNVSAPVDEADVQAREREDEALIEAAAREHVAVTRTHRIDIARLAGIASGLAGKLVDVIEGRAMALEVPIMRSGKPTGEKRVYFPFLGENESLSDALVKVSRALKELVTLERKAFGMDKPDRNPDEGRRDMIPLEKRLASYRMEEAVAEADNVVEFSPPD